MVQFRLARSLHVTPILDTARPSEMTVLIAGRSSLHNLLGEEIAEELLEGLGLAEIPTVRLRHVSARISALLKHAVCPSRSGKLRELHAQAKVLEYLCALCDDAITQAAAGSRRREAAGTVGRRQQRLREISQQMREDLLRAQGKLPTLEELSVQYGASAKLLNETFTREFGSGIMSFITNHRLNQAHEALQSGNVPIKALASLLGYSHVNHFTTAFSRKFGCPPGRLRRQASRGAVE